MALRPRQPGPCNDRRGEHASAHPPYEGDDRGGDEPAVGGLRGHHLPDDAGARFVVAGGRRRRRRRGRSAASPTSRCTWSTAPATACRATVPSNWPTPGRLARALKLSRRGQTPMLTTRRSAREIGPRVRGEAGVEPVDDAVRGRRRSSRTGRRGRCRRSIRRTVPMIVWIASSRSPADTLAVRSAARGCGSSRPPVPSVEGDGRLHPRAREAVVDQGAFLALEVAAERLLDRLAPRRSDQVADREVAQCVVDLLRRRLVEVHGAIRRAVDRTEFEAPGLVVAVDLVARTGPDERDVADVAGRAADLAVPVQVEVGRDEVEEFVCRRRRAARCRRADIRSS